MRKFYSNGVSNKKYGAIAGVTARKDRKEAFYVGMKDYKHLLDFSICFFSIFWVNLTKKKKYKCIDLYTGSGIIVENDRENLKNENNNVMWKFKIQKRDDGNCRKKWLY